jgi:uncharacterized protein YjbI with pentapeptide repeats
MEVMRDRYEEALSVEQSFPCEIKKLILDYAYLMIDFVSDTKLLSTSTHVFALPSPQINYLSHLTNLQFISLQPTKSLLAIDFYKPTSPLEIAFPEGLKRVCLQNCDLKNCDLQNLDSLELLQLPQTQVDWENFDIPETVKELNLSFTDFSGSLEDLKNLRGLTMINCHLASWKRIGFPIKLTKLVLRSTNLDVSLEELKSLVWLDLSGSNHCDWNKIRFPTSLKYLNLQATEFDKDLSYVKSLEILNLSYVNRGEEWDGIFPRNLQELDLSNTDFNHRLDYLSSLKILDLNGRKERSNVKFPEYLEELHINSCGPQIENLKHLKRISCRRLPMKKW